MKGWPIWSAFFSVERQYLNCHLESSRIVFLTIQELSKAQCNNTDYSDTDPFLSVPESNGYEWSNDTAFYKKNHDRHQFKVIVMVFVTSYQLRQRRQPAVLRSVLPNVRVVFAEILSERQEHHLLQTTETM